MSILCIDLFYEFNLIEFKYLILIIITFLQRNGNNINNYLKNIFLTQIEKTEFKEFLEFNYYNNLILKN